MESMVKDSSFHFVRILSKLGIEYGIGLGLAVAHPTKQWPLSYCSLNSNFTYIDCLNDALDEIIHNPKLHYQSNGIDFSYPCKNRILSCQIHFKKMAIKYPVDVTSRIPTAQVIAVHYSVFPDALFYHNRILDKVLECDNQNYLVRCGPVQDIDAGEVVLPIDLVARQV
jgi:hypothetical protein